MRLNKAPAGPESKPGKEKPKARGKSRGSKPRKSAAKSESPTKAGETGESASRLIDERSTTWGMARGDSGPACGR